MRGLSCCAGFFEGLAFSRLFALVRKRLGPEEIFLFSKIVLAVVGMLLVGAKRLRHLTFMGSDPLFLRFVGLSRAPSERSLGRALMRMGWRVWPELAR